MPVEYPNVVKFFIDEDGEIDDSDVWHLVTTSCGDQCALCSGQFFGYGLSTIDNEDGHHYEEKCGRVTCPDCRDIIKRIKKVKL